MPRAAAATTLPEQSSDLPVLTPFDPSAKKVLKLTFREALSLSADNVGTEHILLTLLETRNGNGPHPNSDLQGHRQDAADDLISVRAQELSIEPRSWTAFSQGLILDPWTGILERSEFGQFRSDRL